jgi:MinD-like ATPase involved in chromosome partitioning or flagellar assembly
MIAIFKKVQQINNILESFKNDELIRDFRVFLRTNENLYAYILGNEATNFEEIEEEIAKIHKGCDVECLSEEDLEDSFYDKIFKTSKTINIEKGRRRFDALLDDSQQENKLPCLVATFYSYKGGMGRSTALAAFAMHAAIHEKKNIVILDCDFEAPGFTNFYLKNAGEENQKQGIVEYLLDKSTNPDVEIEKYTWEVGAEYRGEGSIRIMPAGNLNTSKDTSDFLKTDLNHYIEGLARIDFVYQEYIVKKFEELIHDLHKSFKTDIVLIDSRTGFGDVMGVTAFHLSKFVVGFFRNDVQSLPGLHFFLENVVKHDKLQPFIINSILPDFVWLQETLFSEFKETVAEITAKYSQKDLDFPCFSLSRNANLEVLGTSVEKPEHLINLIKNKKISDYTEFFEKLADAMNSSLSADISNDGINDLEPDLDENAEEVADLPDNDTNDEPILDERDEPLSEDNAEDDLDFTTPNELDKAPIWDSINKQDKETKERWAKEIKQKILKDTTDKLGALNLYAENIDIKNEFKVNQFFFRVCMNDLFNVDKVLILGSKGTGKSYIYSALKEKEIVTELKKRAGRQDNYTFFYMVDKTKRIFKVNTFSKDKTEEKRFQYRFWLVYTWQILMQEAETVFNDYTTSLKNLQFPIKSDDTTQTALEHLIQDDKAILAIEKDLNNFDRYLVNKGNGIKEYVTVLYDQLDEIVAPKLWNDWLPSLIDFWREKRYNRIFGKLFVRRDLFRKLVGITNIRELENQAIDIEWTQEELYAFFFKIVLSQGTSEWFWSQMYLYADYPHKIVNQLRPKYNNLGQMPLEEHLLRPLVVTFFGKQVDMGGGVRMGESYEWFAKNLKSADDTISVRPFIELIQLAIDKEKKSLDNNGYKPLLSPNAYNNKDIRKNAVERHFEDLHRNEAGNQPLKYIFNFIDEDRSKKYKFTSLPKKPFMEMLRNVVSEYLGKEGMENQTEETLEQMLIVNGIVKKDNFGRGDVYKFAYLYKYKLGLRGN